MTGNALLFKCHCGEEFTVAARADGQITYRVLDDPLLLQKFQDFLTEHTHPEDVGPGLDSPDHIVGDLREERESL